MPFRISFSQAMCIIIDATNLATMMSNPDAAYISKPDVAQYFQTHQIINNYTKWTNNEFMNTSDL